MRDDLENEKYEYLSNLWSDLNQIWNLVLGADLQIVVDPGNLVPRKKLSSKKFLGK